MVPRQSYFALYVEDVKKHFDKFVAAIGQPQIWFEYKGKPLQWHLPAGVVFDSVIPCNNLDKLELPFEITVHFSNFPQNEIMSFSDEKDIQTNYMYSLKEVCKISFFHTFQNHLLNSFCFLKKQASHMKLGQNNHLLQLNDEDQKKIWTALKESNYSAYKKTIKDVESTVTVEKDKPPRQLSTVAFPVRLILDDNVSKVFQQALDEQPAASRLYSWIRCIHQVPPVKSTSSDASEIVYPEDMTPEQVVEEDKIYATSQTLQSFLETAMANVFGKDERKTIADDIKVLVQGLEPSMDTPMAWLCQTCESPDHYLYVVLRLANI